MHLKYMRRIADLMELSTGTAMPVSKNVPFTGHLIWMLEGSFVPSPIASV